MERRAAVPAVLLAALIAGCGGAREVDYPPGRGISADIDASQVTNPQRLRQGQVEHDEPLDAFPWALDQRHQD
jgi:hypothetical protein